MMFILYIILKILFFLLLFIVGLFIILLSIPVSYSGQLVTSDGLRVQLSLGWAWRLLGVNVEREGEAYDITFRIFNKSIYKLERKKTEENEEQLQQQHEKKEKEKTDGGHLSLKDFTDRALINEIFEYSKRVLDIAGPKYFHLHGIYGFDDPSLTGIVCGATSIIKGIIPNARLNLTPDFAGEVMDLNLRADGSIFAGRLVYQTIRTMLKKPVRKTLFRKKKS